MSGVTKDCAQICSGASLMNEPAHCARHNVSANCDDETLRVNAAASSLIFFADTQGKATPHFPLPKPSGWRAEG